MTGAEFETASEEINGGGIMMMWGRILRQQGLDSCYPSAEIRISRNSECQK